MLASIFIEPKYLYLSVQSFLYLSAMIVLSYLGISHMYTSYNNGMVLGIHAYRHYAPTNPSNDHSRTWPIFSTKQYRVGSLNQGFLALACISRHCERSKAKQTLCFFAMKVLDIEPTSELRLACAAGKVTAYERHWKNCDATRKKSNLRRRQTTFEGLALVAEVRCTTAFISYASIGQGEGRVVLVQGQWDGRDVEYGRVLRPGVLRLDCVHQIAMPYLTQSVDAMSVLSNGIAYSRPGPLAQPSGHSPTSSPGQGADGSARWALVNARGCSQGTPCSRGRAPNRPRRASARARLGGARRMDGA